MVNLKTSILLFAKRTLMRFMSLGTKRKVKPMKACLAVCPRLDVKKHRLYQEIQYDDVLTCRESGWLRVYTVHADLYFEKRIEAKTNEDFLKQVGKYLCQLEPSLMWDYNVEQK